MFRGADQRGWIAFAMVFASTCDGQALGSLKHVNLPAPQFEAYVRDTKALLVLGKALFWDMQVGSDGLTACATCHFHAGADHRIQNQLSHPTGDFPANHVLTADDFPFRVFADPNDNRSAVIRDLSRRAGSAGVFRRVLRSMHDDGAEEADDLFDLPWFHAGALRARQVTRRNTPTVINAVLNVRNFRDGRASSVFTGRTPFGDSDPRPNILVAEASGLRLEKIRIENASLASVAVAPPLNTTEMSYEGRTWPMVGRKLVRARPLALQRVDVEDSVLGAYASADGRGLKGLSYLTLVQAAFREEYWRSQDRVNETGQAARSGVESFTQAEFNFPIFFSLAVQAYASVLVSDDSRFDRFEDGDDRALTVQEKSGLLVFQNRGLCMFCHAGPELTAGGYTFSATHNPIDSVLSFVDGRSVMLTADTGFFHTGVRPAAEDKGLDDVDDFGRSFSLAVQDGLSPLAVGGAFRVPGLRNVELTGPYFHNGGAASLEQAVAFYSRGGDYPSSPGLPAVINSLQLKPEERADLVAFLKAMTDDRVRFERAPFDHPELCVPVGYSDDGPSSKAFPLSAADRWAEIAPIGRNGSMLPLQTFEELLLGLSTGRAHSLREPCRIPETAAGAIR